MPGHSKLFRKQVPQIETVPGLATIEDTQPDKRPYGSRRYGTPPIKGRVSFPDQVYSQVLADSPTKGRIPFGDVAGFSHILEDEVVEEDSHEAGDKGRAEKRERQWVKWVTEVLPEMLHPYLQLVRETDSFRNLGHIRQPPSCSGCGTHRTLDITCVYFDKLEIMMFCPCENVPLSLLRRGLFPSTPTYPTLAVDVTMLEFVRELFVNSSPNMTAWCDTLEHFLRSRKYKLETQSSLRQRFNSALQWYSSLIDEKNLRIRDHLDSIREVVVEVSFEQVTENEQKDDMDIDDEALGDVQSGGSQDGQPLPNRPSEYLRGRCPLCFGGKTCLSPDEIVDAIVCIDACFTQKRRKSQGNAWAVPREHPETVFITPEDATTMEATVEELRPSRPTRTNKEAPLPEPEYDPGLRVPNSVLNDCNDSFVAADANRIKASTQFFSDTGLMALLCRHDRPLFLVNMTSAGERQHYALALLEKLFQHIPTSMRIGLLYDIGCQLHRSCSKHGFLRTILDRIVFGISVFHAYGHQWPCQLIYHPRKCDGFGLTDGEGCERFWSAIKLLIPSLRVSGYYARIYTLDNQIKHLDYDSLYGLGNWLKRKSVKMIERKGEVEIILQEVVGQGITLAHLEDQWKCQVKEQTKPLKRQSPGLANKEIHEVVAMMDKVVEKKEEIRQYYLMMETGEYEAGLSGIEVEAIIEEVEANVERMAGLIRRKKEKLSVDGRLNLKNLLGNVFLKKRMNALALKQRIRDRLRNRKFELSNLERAYRKTGNQLKLDNHARGQIKRKEPGIQALVRKYNKGCKELGDIIKKRQGPRGAVVPHEIEMEGLFKLDVDDDIWQDVGLTDDSDGTSVPDWLGNEVVRRGIKAWLENKRCEEEARRIGLERKSMQEWMREEWLVVTTALASAKEDEDLCYQLQERKTLLLQLCMVWERSVRHIPCTLDPSWGPSILELQEVYDFEYNTQAVVRNDMEVDGTDSEADLIERDFDEGEDDIEAAQLFSDMETMVLPDELYM